MKLRTPTGREFEPRPLHQLWRRVPQEVLAELAELCFANAATFDPDPRVDAYNQGRRHVWLHINKYLTLTPEQIEHLYEGRAIYLTEDEDG